MSPCAAPMPPLPHPAEGCAATPEQEQSMLVWAWAAPATLSTTAMAISKLRPFTTHLPLGKGVLGRDRDPVFLPRSQRVECDSFETGREQRPCQEAVGGGARRYVG